TSSLPAGISSRSRSTAARYWRTISAAVPSSMTGTIDAAPGWCTRSRVNSSPDGSANVPTATVIRLPRWTSRSASLRNRLNLDEPWRPALGTGERGTHQLAEQRMGPVGPALELGMGLRADPERMARQLDELDEAVVGRHARAPHPALLQPRAVARVDLVAVPVAFVYELLAIRRRDLRTRQQPGRVHPEAHGAAHLHHLALLVHEVDDQMRRADVELTRVRAGEAADVASEVDHHHLEAEAEPEARDAVVAGVAGGRDLALDPPLAEPAGDDDAVEVAEPAARHQPLDLLGLDPVDLELGPVPVAALAERLHDREVGVGQVDVLADQ